MPQSSRQHRRGVVMVTLSAVSWSSAGLFTRLIETDAWTLLFYRGIFGAITAAIWLAITERGGAFRAVAGMGKGALAYSVISTLAMVSYVVALKTTSVAHVAIIYALLPFLTGAIAWAVFGEKIGRSAAVASVIAIAGVAVAVSDATGEGGYVGDVLSVVMTAFMAVTILIARFARAIPLVPAAGLSAVWLSLVTAPFATPSSAMPSDIFYVAVFAVVSLTLGLILFTRGSRLIPAAEAALIGLLDTPLAPLWVWIAFNEVPPVTTIVGGSVALAAVTGHILTSERLKRV